MHAAGRLCTSRRGEVSGYEQWLIDLGKEKKKKGKRGGGGGGERRMYFWRGGRAVEEDC